MVNYKFVDLYQVGCDELLEDATFNGVFFVVDLNPSKNPGISLSPEFHPTEDKIVEMLRTEDCGFCPDPEDKFDACLLIKRTKFYDVEEQPVWLAIFHWR
jgi:hypothetical protein